MRYLRFAIYATPAPGPLADFGASWLGWDLRRGEPRTPLKVTDLPLAWDKIIETPRKYGFHGTIKAPFALAEGLTQTQLMQAFATLCKDLPPITLAGMELVQLGRFLALIPTGPTDQLTNLAAQTVRGLDGLRAPLTKAELTRRRSKARLSPEQDALLVKWGYPYVMDHFRFHLTLTAKLPKAQTAQTLAALRPIVAPLIEGSFVISKLCLCGEDDQGRFHMLAETPLGP